MASICIYSMSVVVMWRHGLFAIMKPLKVVQCVLAQHEFTSPNLNFLLRALGIIAHTSGRIEFPL